MDFSSYSDPNESADAISAFLRSADGRALPDDVQSIAWSFMGPGGSTSFAVSNFVELIYARMADVTPIALALAASVGAYCNFYAVDDLGGARGRNVIGALRRDSGERAPTGKPWPKRADDPDSRDEFKKAAVYINVDAPPVTVEDPPLPAAKGRTR